MEEQKQIEEMGNAVYLASPLPAMWRKDALIISDKLYRAGYRKASDVAAEIFAEIKQKIADLEYNAKVPRKTVTVETLMEQVNWVLHEVVPETLDEIEKKYTESEGAE